MVHCILENVTWSNLEQSTAHDRGPFSAAELIALGTLYGQQDGVCGIDQNKLHYVHVFHGSETTFHQVQLCSSLMCLEVGELAN